MGRFLLVVVLMMSGQFVWADDYYWTFPGATQKYSDPSVACNAVLSNNGQYLIDEMTFSFVTDAVVSCTSKRSLNGSSWDRVYQTVTRLGDSCAPGSIYDPSAGTCSAPEEDTCQAKVGGSQVFTKSGNAGDGYFVTSGGYGIPAQDACFSGCAVSTVDQKCTSRVSGSYTCRGVAYYTGQGCDSSGSGTDVIGADTETPEPEPQVISEEKPCQYVEQADGTLACDSQKSTEKEGQSCGTVNGVRKCVDAPPTKNGIDIRTEVTSESLADGGTKTTKTDVATITKCSGINQCTTTTTTNTTTTTTDPSGKVTQVGGTCSGPACPDENTNPDGNGDGLGDCVVSGGPECSDGDDEYPELEEGDDFGEATDKFLTRVEGSPLVSAVSGLQFAAGGSCSFNSFSVPMLGTLSFQPMCAWAADWFAPLRAILLALWALVAIRTFMEA